MLAKRAIALCLGLLLAIGAIVPLATNDAEAGPRHKRHHRHYKKYSKKWWREYHRRQARRRALAKRKRMLRLRQLRLARAAAAAKADGQDKPVATKADKKPASTTQALPTGDPAPAGWSASKASSGELQFRVDNSSGAQVGSASIAVVGPANPNDTGRNTLGGVATTALRRDVIDRMIKENGWVVNDYQKEIAGQPVYVVVAQSQARNGQTQQRMFYFTEVEGKIYSVSTISPVNEAERLAEESEKVINSLKAKIKPGLRASN